MGTTMQILDAELRVTGADLSAAAEALEFADTDELLHALQENGWVMLADGSGGINGIEFVGDKLHGDMDELLPSLAPYIEADSYIQFEGDVFLRYEFDGRRCLVRYSEDKVAGREEVEPQVLFGPELEVPEDLEDHTYLGLDDDEESADELDF